MWKGLALVIALVAGFAIFYLGAVTPRPVAPDAPTERFSAGRAMVDIRAMGATPHPAGSPADARVRDHLVARMTGLGLHPRVQRAASFAVYGSELEGASVDNVIGILPGRDPTAPALVLMAHHDTVPGSPGAADDTTGVAAALEIVRAIHARGVPARDVMLVITDGEEPGLLGARAFFDQSPLASHVGYVLNLEARGGGGRAMMFETAPRDGADIALFRRTAAAPNSNALTVFVYRRLPNGTDFTIAVSHGKVGLNYAFIGRQFDYHSPSSTVRALDKGSVQHMGDEVLPTAAALAFGPLPGRAPDVVYGNLIGDLTAAYPAVFGWAVLALAAVLITVGAVRARRRGAFALADVARGTAASLYVVALCGTLLELLRRATGVPSGWTEYRPILAQFPLFEVMMLAAALGGLLAAAAFVERGGVRALAAVLVVVAGLASSLFGGPNLAGLVLGGAGAVIAVLAFGAPARLPGAWTGLLSVALVAGVVIQAAAPTAGAAVAWPLSAAALASALSAAGADHRALPRAAIIVIAALTLAWLGTLFHGLLQGLDLALLAVLPAWLAALVLWPLAAPDEGERAALWPAAAVILVGVAVAGAIRLHDPWTQRYPDAVEPLYVVEPGARRAWRASPLPPGPWTRSVLEADGGRIGRLRLPFDRELLWAAPAPAAPADSPPVAARIAADGTLVVVAHPNPGAAGLWIALRSPHGITGVTVDGRPADLAVQPGRWACVKWSGSDGFSLRVRSADPRAVEIVTGELFDRWLNPEPLPPVPASDQLWDLAGSSLVIGRVGVGAVSSARG
ncbi:MAG: peptidase [Caulobacteraceae bacterium]|nr:peptidase [Caulobacteraceae bacterium]